MSHERSTTKSLRRTKLDDLLEGKQAWDDTTWFQVERDLIERFSVPGMLMFVSGCGVELTGASQYFKTDAVKELRGVPPQTVLEAWHRWRARHR